MTTLYRFFDGDGTLLYIGIHLDVAVGRRCPGCLGWCDGTGLTSLFG